MKETTVARILKLVPSLSPYHRKARILLGLYPDESNSTGGLGFEILRNKMSDYIPAELIPNILARLPVESVVRCTSVCKSWYSLITSSSFISSHFKLSSPNHEPRLLVNYSIRSNDIFGIKRRYCVYRDNETFDEITEIDCQITYPKNVKIIDTCNGLVCLSDPMMDRIILWNPSLRKYLTLPNPNVTFDAKFHFQSIGFGFVPTVNDFKIVKISYYDLWSVASSVQIPPEIEVYELRTGSWRSLCGADCSYITTKDIPQALLNGIVHWYAYNLTCRLIGSFDLKTERFGVMTFPSYMNRNLGFTISTYRDSLCLIEDHDAFCSIWIMKEYGVIESWENLFKINIQEILKYAPRPLYFKENGDILFANVYGYRAEITPGSNAAISCPIFTYDPDKNMFKTDGMPEEASEFCAYPYVESLVLINCPNQVSRLNEIGEGSKSTGKEVSKILLN